MSCYQLYVNSYQMEWPLKWNATRITPIHSAKWLRTSNVFFCSCCPNIDFVIAVSSNSKHIQKCLTKNSTCFTKTVVPSQQGRPLIGAAFKLFELLIVLNFPNGYYRNLKKYKSMVRCCWRTDEGRIPIERSPLSRELLMIIS